MGWEVRGSLLHKASQLEIPESLNGNPNQTTMAEAPCLLGQKGSVAIVQTHTHADAHTHTRNACRTVGMDVVVWWHRPTGQFGTIGRLKRAFHCLSHEIHIHALRKSSTHTHTHRCRHTYTFPSILKLKTGLISDVEDELGVCFLFAHLSPCDSSHCTQEVFQFLCEKHFLQETYFSVSVKQKRGNTISMLRLRWIHK